MGNFKVPNREIVIMLEGDFAGAEIVCKQDVSIGTFLEMQKMSSNDDTIVESYKKFGNDILLRWNLVDDKEKPIKADSDGMLSLSPDIAISILTKWTEYAAGNQNGSSPELQNGNTLAEESIPAETK